MIENTFGINIIPDNDVERLAALERYRIMDTPSEASFDNVARLASRIFNVPIALVSLVDAERVFFKANHGMGNAKEANRGKSLCALAVMDSEVIVFEDALQEPCLLANPNVIGEFGLRFYAGAPLITHDGFSIGTLCVIDKKVRKFSEQDREILEGLSIAVMDQIELRLSALDEIDNHRRVNTELEDFKEELFAMNEELTSSNEELIVSSTHLTEINSELYEANIKLNESEMQFRNLVMQAPVSICYIQAKDLYIKIVNDSYLELVGKSRQAFENKTIWDAVPEAAEAYAPVMQQVIDTGIAFSAKEHELTLIRNGRPELVIVDFVYEPIKKHSGETEAILVIGIDVTEKVLARKRISEMEERVRLAVDSAEMGTYDLDARTGIILKSERFDSIFGISSESWADYVALVHPADLEVRSKAHEQALTTGKLLYEARINHEDGVRWLKINGQYHVENGTLIRVIGVVADITDSKFLQQQKDDFLGIASHELKTPLTSLKASLQLLNRVKDNPTSPVFMKLMDQLNTSMIRMSALVDELLNVNRITAGQLKLNKTNFKLADMLNMCCNHIRVEGKYNLSLSGDLDLAVYADEHRIDQVVVNLVNNAVKYASQSKNIDILIEKVDEWAKVSVRDYGPGIPDEKKDHLFDRYYRADYSGHIYSGLGLGLYISEEIIKRHDGEIGVDSKLGEGSTFWFKIPLSTGS